MGVFIIAEAGVNHNGDIKLAKELVDLAVECGADAIKFQTFKTEEIISKNTKKAPYQIENTQTNESQYDMVKRLELSYDDFIDIYNYCKKKNIIFLSTPDGFISLSFLASLDLPYIKIGSGEITNYPFLKQVAKLNKPIILSTGMSSLGEIENAIDVINKAGNNKIILMHCTTDYPTKVEDVNIKVITTLKQAFQLPVGYSDHTLSNEAAIAAIALGAEFIEKHITLDKNLPGPDHKASMDGDEFKKYVKSLRNVEKILGNGIKKPTSNEIINKQFVRRSIVASIDIKKGTVLESYMLDFKRPGTGISPQFVDLLIGCKVNKDIKKDELIKWEDILNQ